MPMPKIPMKIPMPTSRVAVPDPLLALATWLSPAFPVGAFTYSHGLETAVADGTVRDRYSTEAWIGGVLCHGAGRNDAILLAEAARRVRAGEALADLVELGLALSPSPERRLETEAQGRAFAETIAAVWGGDVRPAPYPIAVGRACGRLEVPVDRVAALYLNAFVGNLVSAAQRLVPLGQVEGQAILAALHPLCDEVARQAAAASLDDLGGLALKADIASMQHETQTVRLFRS